jgi:hypothetical protein
MGIDIKDINLSFATKFKFDNKKSLLIDNESFKYKVTIAINIKNNIATFTATDFKNNRLIVYKESIIFEEYSELRGFIENNLAVYRHCIEYYIIQINTLYSEIKRYYNKSDIRCPLSQILS